MDNVKEPTHREEFTVEYNRFELIELLNDIYRPLGLEVKSLRKGFDEVNGDFKYPDLFIVFKVIE